jgi:hypothetical protein
VIEVLAGIAGATTLALVPLVAWLTYKLVRSKDEQILAVKRIEQLDSSLSEVRGELNTETAAHAATSDELRKEKLLRASAEAQRNDAERRVRDHVVEFISKSGIADAAALGNRILSAPLPGARLSETPGNDLEKP